MLDGVYYGELELFFFPTVLKNEREGQWYVTLFPETFHLSFLLGCTQ